LDREIIKPICNLLLLDNCTTHPKLNLQNIDFKFLPLKTTSLIQPLDQGIIKTIKTYYRKSMQNFIFETINVYEILTSQIAHKITVLKAIHMYIWRLILGIKGLLNAL